MSLFLLSLVIIGGIYTGLDRPELAFRLRILIFGIGILCGTFLQVYI